MNVRNFRYPFTQVSHRGKYNRVKEVFFSCDDTIQMLVTLKWAYRIGLSTDEIITIMGMCQWECIKEANEALAESLNQPQEEAKSEPSTGT